jgi:glyoxylase I family protein
MFKRIDHVEIIPSDFEKSIEFYTEVLGFVVKQRMKVAAPPLDEIAYLELGDTLLELMRVPDAACATTEPWNVGYRMMALEVEDMDQAIEYLAGKGVAITWGPVDLGKSKRAEIHDADGFPIELRQW